MPHAARQSVPQEPAGRVQKNPPAAAPAAALRQGAPGSISNRISSRNTLRTGRKRPGIIRISHAPAARPPPHSAGTGQRERFQPEESEATVRE